MLGFEHGNTVGLGLLPVCKQVERWRCHNVLLAKNLGGLLIHKSHFSSFDVQN